MGESFLDFMKGIGIFIICAQSLMHFSAGKSYEKYVKLLIGVMILAQFVVPVRNLFLGTEGGELHEEVERFQAELEYAMQTAGQTVQESGLEVAEVDSMEALEAEIEQRLADTARSYGYQITAVRMMEEPPKAIIVVEEAWEQAKEESMQIESMQGEAMQVEPVNQESMQGETVNQEPVNKGFADQEPVRIQIDQIEIGQSITSETETEHAKTNESMLELQEVFAGLLGAEESYVEVVTE